MYKLCVFAGTTEGRELVDFFSGQDVSVTACVATEYGETLLTPRDNLTISARRLTREEMEELFSRERFDMVIDATHPYASVVTENIAAACETAGVRYLRLLRSGCKAGEDAVFVPDIPGAVDYLNGTEGAILLTTGSKDLAAFAAIPEYQERLWVRILPNMDSLSTALSLGYPASHIICMQGPFSRKMNVATLESMNGALLVTKDTGKAGGFGEKAAAAREAGARLLVIRRPVKQQGLELEAMLELLTGGRV